MAYKDWRKAKEDDVGSITYINQTGFSFVSARISRNGWAYHTPKIRRGEVKTKAEANAIIKRYMKRYRS